MNIIFCCQSAGLSNIALGETRARILSLSKQKKISKIFIISLDKNDRSFEKNNIKLFRVLGSNKFTKSISLLIILLKIFQKYKITFIYSYMSYIFPYFAFPFKLIFDTKIFFWNCHTVKNRFTALAIKYLVDKWLVSDFVYKIYDTNKCNNLNYSVADYFKFPNHMNFNTKKIDLIVVSRITPIKNIDTIIDALYILKKIHKIELRCVIIGNSYIEQDKKYYQFLLKRISYLNLSKIKFIGFIPNNKLNKIYYRSKIFLSACPGGLGKSGAEALVCGCIPITTELNMSIYSKKYNKLLNCEHDKFKLALKIKEILYLDSHNLKKTLSYLENLSKNFSYEKFNNKLLNLI